MTNKMGEPKFEMTNEIKQFFLNRGYIEKRPGYLRHDEMKISKYYCQDCLINFPDFYMVHDNLWKQAGFNSPSDGIICVYCLEKRLNRNLTIEDFNDAPVNDAYKFGYIMASRELIKHSGRKYPMGVLPGKPNIKIKGE